MLCSALDRHTVICLQSSNDFWLRRSHMKEYFFLGELMGNEEGSMCMQPFWIATKHWVPYLSNFFWNLNYGYTLTVSPCAILCYKNAWNISKHCMKNKQNWMHNWNQSFFFSLLLFWMGEKIFRLSSLL